MDSQNRQQEDKQGQQIYTDIPVPEPSGINAADPTFGPLGSAPGPMVPQNMPAQEGTEEERKERKKALNSVA